MVFWIRGLVIWLFSINQKPMYVLALLNVLRWGKIFFHYLLFHVLIMQPTYDDSLSTIKEMGSVVDKLYARAKNLN